MFVDKDLKMVYGKRKSKEKSVTESEVERSGKRPVSTFSLCGH